MRIFREITVWTIAATMVVAGLLSSVSPVFASAATFLSHTRSLPGDVNSVAFTDPNLESAIREALGNPRGDLSPVDLARLTKLDAFSRGIANLAGIQYCTSLTYLDLRQNRISDISPLSNLTYLGTLYLYDNRITDITPLTNLTGLTDLTLRNNLISDISPLARLTGIRQLYLSENQITDISPLSRLKGLTNLYLSNNRITDVTPLRSLSNLQELRLDGNQISDISALVQNSGLAEGDQLLLQGNNLDLQQGSTTLQYIITLEKRGVNVQPPSGQTVPIHTDGGSFWTVVWSLVAAVFILGLALRIVRGSATSRRRASGYSGRSYSDESDIDHQGDSTDVYIHQRTVRCPNCRGTGRVPSLYIPRTTVRCPDCDGTGRLFD